MKDKLIDLAARWNTVNCNGMKPHECAAELLEILDAEGDGGAVGEPAAWMMTCAGYGRPVEFYTEKPGFVPAISEIVPLYTRPARSGVVSDEEMNRCERLLTACTCHADFKDRDMVDPQCCACELGDEVIDTFRAMRSAIQGERHEL